MPKGPPHASETIPVYEVVHVMFADASCSGQVEDRPYSIPSYLHVLPCGTS